MPYDYDDSYDDGYSTSPPSRRKRRCTRAKLFQFFGPIQEGYSSGVRTEFLNMFAGFDIQTYCISVEPRYVGKRGAYLRAYLEFVDMWNLKDLQIYIHNNLPEEMRANMTLEIVQNRKNGLISVSKVDRTPLFNCMEDELSFGCRAYKWAQRTMRFSNSDPFVVEHRLSRTFLREFHADVRKDVADTFSLQPCEFTNLCKWTVECALWFNSRFRPARRFKRKPQLYLYGPSEVGKSSFIETLIGRKDNWSRVYLPEPGRFAFGDLDPTYHKVVLFEEFQPHHFSVGDLNRLLEGRTFGTLVRGGTPKMITFTGHVIFISVNFDVTDPGLLARLKIVQASERYWTYPCGPLPKQEPNDDDSEKEVKSEDIIVLSSDDDGDDKSKLDLVIPGPSSCPP